MKKVFKLNESQVSGLVAECTRKVLKENFWIASGPDAPAPSSEEENFEDALYSVVEEYSNVATYYGRESFIKWCVEIINKALGPKFN